MLPVLSLPTLQDRNANSAESRASGAEKQLVAASEALMALRTELGYKSAALTQVRVPETSWGWCAPCYCVWPASRMLCV